MNLRYQYSPRSQNLLPPATAHPKMEMRTFVTVGFLLHRSCSTFAPTTPLAPTSTLLAPTSTLLAPPLLFWHHLYTFGTHLYSFDTLRTLDTIYLEEQSLQDI